MFLKSQSLGGQKRSKNQTSLLKTCQYPRSFAVVNVGFGVGGQYNIFCWQYIGAIKHAAPQAKLEKAAAGKNLFYLYFLYIQLFVRAR